MHMNHEYRHAVRGVWEHGHAAYASWPDETREIVQPGVDELLRWLADADEEDQLIDRYMALSGPPRGATPPGIPKPTFLAAAALEDECFWRRAAEIERSAARA